MADIVVVAAHVRATNPRNAEIYDGVAAEAIAIGQILYVTSAGKMGVADANASGKQQARAIALNAAGVGGAVSYLKRGHVSGFTIPQAYDAQVFLSDTAGAIADAAGTMSVAVGRVVPVSDASYTKLIYFDFNWVAQAS